MTPLSMSLLSDSWRRAWRSLAASPRSPVLHAQLIAHYAEPQRKYHTLQHLAECIAQLEPALGLCAHPGEVEIALWFHDAIYDLERSDNELQSALWAAQVLASAGLSAEVCERVKNLVLATRHSALPATADECLLVDVDLAILGAEPARFDDYERQIRQEYFDVPFPLFCEKRRAILAQFLARPQLYSSEFFRSALETKARENLARSLSRTMTER
jgi:predicted metal-dependent HD superfamily phosphohydrolase